MKSTSFIRKIISNPLVQTLAVYISGGWILIELMEYFIAHFDLVDKFRNILLIILLAGLPVALIISWLMNREKSAEEHQAKEGNTPHRKPSRLFRNPIVTIPSFVLFLALIIFGIRYLTHRSRTKWAKEVAIEQMQSLFHQMKMTEAFEAAKQAEKYIPGDSAFQELARMIITRMTFLSDPPGADVYLREYGDTVSEWNHLGVTPIDSIELPNRVFYAVRYEKPGYSRVTSAVPSTGDTLYRQLFSEKDIPEGMVWVEGLGAQVTGDYLREKNGFFIDRFEVTNKQFKKFVDHGGYRDPGYWKHEFLLDGEKLAWKDAMNYFVDASGRPGPASWQASDYPEGMGDYPVSGISWYEAEAYANFAGKALPTRTHWATAAGLYFSYIYYNYGSWIKRFSNYSGTEVRPETNHLGLNSYGTFGMAGNVREWCWNKTEMGHLISGGAWNDAEYMYANTSQLPAFDRSLKNGFRCVIYPEKEKIASEVFDPVEIGTLRDYTKETPEPEYAFQIYRKQFLYDQIPLEPEVEPVDDHPEEWTIEKVSFNAAYDNERVAGYLYKPKNGTPPLQTLIFFPGSYAVTEEDIPHSIATPWFADFLLKNGRAVFFPVYKGTYQRNDGLTSAMHMGNHSHEYTDWLIKWAQDLSRTIDYLTTRSDIDSSRIGYYAHSWGGIFGGIFPALEDRLKVSILVLGGFDTYSDAYPEADPINYISHVRIPVLMLNGRYDARFPFETTVQPFYDLLGTPEDQKVLVLTDTDHFVPKSVMIKEILNFLDTYFGPAR